MELQDWRKEPRKNYSNEFKLRMVELASQPGACVAQIARENGVNDNVIFKLNRPGFPGEYFICELRLPDHYFRW
ncbi:transposase, partial [Escherichia coli]|uniref:transposase n=2 Tax=Escherichia coli TaxID=562 RepID=UPI0002B9B347